MIYCAHKTNRIWVVRVYLAFRLTKKTVELENGTDE